MDRIMEFIIPLAISIGIGVAILLIFREIFCWYWKFNRIVSELSNSNKNLNKIINILSN